jgi:hypothetical protein
MNQEIKISDYYPYLDLLLNELKVASLLLSYHQRKGQEEGILDSLGSKIFIGMSQTINDVLLDRTQKIGKIIGYLYDKKQLLLSRSDKKLFKIITLDVDNKVDLDASKKFKQIAVYIQNIDIILKNANLIKSLGSLGSLNAQDVF